jgi:hypothetical protein
MPVPSAISDLSQTAASNSPAGSESPNTIDDYARAHGAFIATLRDGKGFTAEATVASAATCDIGGANSLFVQVTGVTTVTSFGSNYTGPRFLRFAGSLVLTHNASTLVLPGGANITTAAGDTAIVVPQSAGWRVVSYERAASLPAPGNGPAFSAYQSAAQSLATGVQTKILFQSEEFDTAGAFDATTNYRFQPTVAGYYQIQTTVSLASMAIAYLFKNGSEFKRGLQYNTANISSSVTALVYLNGTTDYVEAYALQSSGASQNTNAGANLTYFQGFLARAA